MVERYRRLLDPMPVSSAIASAEVSAHIIKALSESQLSDASKALYLRKLEILAELRGRGTDIWTAISSHTKTIAALLEKHEGHHASLQTFATSVLSAFKYVPGLKDQALKSHGAWQAVHADAHAPLEAHTMTGQPTERQALGWVPFAEVMAKRESLPLGSDARLLISVYSLIAPRRNDYSNLRIYSKTPENKTSGNYLVLRAGKSGGATLTLNDYKTSKKHASVSEELPEALITEIRASLSRRPREYLFVSTRDRLPYKSESSFSTWANSLLLRTFKKPLTLTGLRHVYITDFLKFDDMTPGERLEVATRMGHGIEMQSRYKFVFRPATVNPSTPKKDKGVV